METFHLYHLATCWKGRTLTTKAGSTPLTTGPVSPTISQTASSPTHPVHPAPLTLPNSVIRAAATHLVFASRKSQDFITPQQVAEVEKWTGQVRVQFLNSQGLSNLLTTLHLPRFGFVIASGGIERVSELDHSTGCKHLNPRCSTPNDFSSECTQSKTLFGKSYRNLIASQSNISVVHLLFIEISMAFSDFAL